MCGGADWGKRPQSSYQTPPARAAGCAAPSWALDALTLGRAHLALALQSLAKDLFPEVASVDTQIASARFEEAVERLRV